MKKLIKRKLYNNNGISKNFFLWEISGDRGVIYEIIEEFKGQRIARAMLRGMYGDRLKAMNEFRKVITAEATTLRAPTVSQRLAFN
jgi:hypothetical protein